MFTKLHMIDNQLVLTNYFECSHVDVISDVTIDRCRLEFDVFRACEYYNLRSLHPMFIKLNPVNNQPVLLKYNELPHDDINSDITVNQFRLEFSIFQTCEYNNLVSLHPTFTKLDMIDNQLVLTNFIE